MIFSPASQLSSETTSPTGTGSAITCTDQKSCQIALGQRIIQLAQQKKTTDSKFSDSVIQQDTGAKNFECLVLQQALVESTIQQCKQVQTGNNPLYCNGDSSNVIGGDSGNSVGVMQINLGKHSDAVPVAYTFDSNVNYALNMLINGYNPASLNYYCYRPAALKNSPINPATDFETMSYSGWQRALRNYNGWNGPTPSPKCTSVNPKTGAYGEVGNPRYVDDIMAQRSKFNANFFPDCM